MKPAAEFQQVTRSLTFWQSYDPTVKVDLSCCARELEAGLVFIDPIPLAPEALDELTAIARPAAIVLTNGNHGRAAAAYRARFNIPVFAHSDAVRELGFGVDQVVEEGDKVLNGLEVIELPGAGAGEIALHHGTALHFGDAVVHLQPLGLSILPDKYCSDAKALRPALSKLLRFDLEILTFAHGLPLATLAHRRLAELVS
jgi:hypothetical protein